MKKNFLKTITVAGFMTAAVAPQAFAAEKTGLVPFMTYMKDAFIDTLGLNDDNNSDNKLGGIDDEGRDAPLFIRNDIPITYNSPSPSQVKPELIGPVQFIRSARVHEDEGTVTFRLYQGHLKNGANQWYIITDTNSRDLADHQGLGYSAKLGFSDHGKAVREVKIANDGTFVFDKGAVDFAPARQIVAGNAPNFFPPKTAQPGSIGDADYTPIVKVNGVYYNAPVVAGEISAADLAKMGTSGKIDYSKVHDKVVRIDLARNLITLKMTAGYSFSKPVFYVSTDANDPVAATLEESTLAPALNDANQDIPDHFTGQGNERLAIFINGPMGKNNPFRQGIQSAMVDGTFPLNIFGGIPTINLDYSPLWDAQLVQWTPDAIKNGYRTRIIDLLQMYGLEKKGVLEGFGGGPIKRSGIIINCPVISRLQ
jgi:hypothetical protein